MSHQPSKSNEEIVEEFRDKFVNMTVEDDGYTMWAKGEYDDIVAPYIRTILEAKSAETKRAVEAERERIRQLLPKRDTGFNLCLDRVYDALMPPEVSNDTEHECHCDVHDCCSVHKVSNDTP